MILVFFIINYIKHIVITFISIFCFFFYVKIKVVSFLFVFALTLLQPLMFCDLL